MCASRKLYYDDAYQTEFRATLVDSKVGDGVSEVELDGTFFYPTSGGQPHDTGTLAGRKVVEVWLDGDRILHRIEGEAPSKASQVECTIDWRRRFDHMQQHTGQHLLSQAFIALLGAETRSFHLGEWACTIDIDRPCLSPEEIYAVEDLANQVVYEDRAVRAYLVPPDRASSLPLRKPPQVAGEVRIVEVEGYDFSACGGTHCARTGAVGSVKVRRWEKYKGMARVEFYCGRRALEDYRWKNRHLFQAARALGVQDTEVADRVERLLAEAAEKRAELKGLKACLQEVEAEGLWNGAEPAGRGRLVTRVFQGRDAKEVRLLVQQAIHARKDLVVLAGVGGDAPQLLYACSPDLSLELHERLRRSCSRLGGRGGGQAHFAQGGVPAGAALEQELERTAAEVRLALGAEGGGEEG